MTWRSTDPRRRRKDWPLCGAWTRAGGQCQVRAEPGKARCQLSWRALDRAQDRGRPRANRRGAAPSLGGLSRRVGDRQKAVVMSPKQYRDALHDSFGRELLDVHGAIHDP
jgi:hypothetical protein